MRLLTDALVDLAARTMLHIAFSFSPRPCEVTQYILDRFANT